MFGGKIEELDQSRTLPIGSLNIIEDLQSTDIDEADDVQQGWALRQTKKSTPYSNKARAFLEDLFQEGFVNKRKLNPKEAEKRMRAAQEHGNTLFLPNELLNYRQIASYFSRIAQKRRVESGAETLPTASSTDDNPTVEDEHDLQYEAIFIEPVDELLLDIATHQSELFLPDDASATHERSSHRHRIRSVWRRRCKRLLKKCQFSL
jgi:hypothetical protein